MIEVSDGSLSVDIKSDIKKLRTFLNGKKIKMKKNLNLKLLHHFILD